MATAPSVIQNFSRDRLQAYAPFVVFVIGWLALYATVYFDFAATVWQRDENAHAPFIMAICIGTAWARITSPQYQHKASKNEFYVGLAAVVVGLLILLLGQASEATIFISFSQFVVAVGAAISFFGWRGAKALWFPLMLSLYLIVWPGWVLDVLTAPLKQFISQIVSDGLFAAGLPVSHSGAIISAGQYHLLVADACAGLNSLVALTAVGAVYLYVVKRQSRAINVAVLAALVPIAIAANLVRVTALVLITYYWGYDAGQGFLHEGAGLVMFAFALVTVFAVDSLAAFFWRARQ